MNFHRKKIHDELIGCRVVKRGSVFASSLSIITFFRTVDLDGVAPSPYKCVIIIVSYSDHIWVAKRPILC